MARTVFEEGDEVKLLKRDTVSMHNLLKDAQTEESRENYKEAQMLRKAAEMMGGMTVGGTFVVAENQDHPDELVALVMGNDEVFVRPTLVKLIE